ncbi:MAG: hypothetical protein U1E65_35825 [Myxococcota bacterium]
MSFTIQYRSTLELRSTSELDPSNAGALRVPPEAMQGASQGPFSAARALRQIFAANGISVPPGTSDAELAMRALSMDWPPEAKAQIQMLCGKILEAALAQAQRGNPSGPAETCPRRRAHAMDGARMAQRIADRAPDPKVGIDPKPDFLKDPKVGIDPKPDFLKDPKVGIDPKPDFLKGSGVDAARAANDFSIAQGRKPEYLDAALDPSVAKDAKAYVAARPELQAAADRMLGALGPLPPGKADRWVTDFALQNYASEGKAAGQTWPGATAAKVDKLVDVKDKPATIEPHETKLPYVTIRESGTPTGVLDNYDTEGREGVKFGAAVSAGSHTVVNVDGRNNTVDFCSNPYPSPEGRGDAILGGAKNKGQADLTGTLLVRAGDANQWKVQDPSQRAALNGPDVSAFQASERDQLAAQAKKAQVVLEGTAADWSVRVDAKTATYTNTKTGTSVELPAGAQGQVRYVSSADADALATALKSGAGG